LLKQESDTHRDLANPYVSPRGPVKLLRRAEADVNAAATERMSSTKARRYKDASENEHNRS
jgi:hypothetical protein